MADKADESPMGEPVGEKTVTVETEAEVTNAEEVLDQVPEVDGDLVDNPVLDEAEEAEAEAEVEQEESEESEDDKAESEDAGGAEEAEKELPKAEAEKDETSVDTAAEDPGDFQPQKDYSFEVTTTDGKTVKINSQAEADKFAERLDNEESLLTASQFAKFARGIARMDGGIERERADYDAKKEQFDLQQAQDKVRDDQVKQWNNEVSYLRAKGLLPKPTAEADRDWLNNKEAEGVKEAMAIFEWMDKENQARRQAGIAEVSSAVDAFRMMQAEQAETVADEERIKEGDTRRAKGSRVKGSSVHVPSDAPKNSIIGEGGSLRDLIYEAQMNI